MPTFEIGLDDGRKLHIEADDQAAALAGAQHFTSTEAPKDTSLVGGFRQGVANTIRGIGQTVGQVPGGSAAVEAGGNDLANKMQAPNYDPAKVIDKDGVHLGELPRAVAENATGAMLPIIAKSLLSKISPKLGMAAGLGTAAAEYFGPNVHARADAEGHSEPTTGDKLAATGTTAAQMAADAVLLKRFGGAAADISPGQAALKNIATAGIGGASTGAQSAIGQVGSTVGTPGGTQFDPMETANAAIGGAATAGAMGAPKALAEAHLANKFSQFGGENKDASAAVANRLQSATDGNLASPKTGKEAFDATRGDIQRELKDATKAVSGRSPLPTDVDNALSRAASGDKLTDAEIAQVKSHADTDADGDRLMHLVRQAQVTQMLSKMGSMTPDSFGGGLAGKMKAQFPTLTKPGPALAAGGMAALGLHGLPGFIGMYSPAAIGATFGGYGLAKLAGKMTGSASPANQFAKRFANAAVPVRGTPFAPPAPPVPPGLPTSPTGPKISPTPSPWGHEPPMEPGEAPPPEDVTSLKTNIALHTGLAKIMEQLSAQKAASNAANAPPAPAPPPDPAEILKQQIKDATDLMDARRSNDKLASPAGQMRDAAAQMAARASNVKLAQALAKARGERSADEEAAQSPAITDLDTVSQPGFGSRASKLLSAQSALNRLRAQPPEETTEAPALAPEPKAPKEPKVPDYIKEAKTLVAGLKNRDKIKANTMKSEAQAAPKSAPIGNSQPQIAQAPKEPEKIASAAIRVDGKIYQGNGHYEAIENATKHTGKSIDELTDRVQNEDLDGFYTSHGRYVSRDEAMKISAANNQTKEGHTPASGKDFSTEMIDHKTLQDVSPDAPAIAEPIVTKVSKANGKVKHETAKPPVSSLKGLWSDHLMYPNKPDFHDALVNSGHTHAEVIGADGNRLHAYKKPSSGEQKKQDTASPMHDALADAFEPKRGPKEFPFYGQEHDEVADAKMADKYKNVKDPDRRDVIREGIISGRMADEEKIMAHNGELTENKHKAELLNLLEEFHHTSSRQRAREARNHYVRLLPPEVGKKVMSDLSDAYINKSKRKD